VTRRWLSLIAAVSTCIAVSIGLVAAAPAAAPSRLLVGGVEFRLTLSRSTVKPGRVTIQLQNRGEDEHDLRLQRITSRTDAPVARWAPTKPGDVASLTVRLSRGRYRLWCSLPGHRELGMRATLRVSRTR
jgi:plastocyanin